MKIIRTIVKGLKLFNDDTLDMNFIAEQRTTDDNNKSVDRLFNNIYLNRLSAFVGKNASGKTTELNVYDFVHSAFLLTMPITNIDSASSLIGNDFTFITYFYDNLVNKLYKLESNIIKDSGRLRIVDEVVSEKNVKSSISKNNLFKDYKIIAKRTTLKQEIQNAIPDYTTYFLVYTNMSKSSKSPSIRNLRDFNNYNLMFNADEFKKYNLNNIIARVLNYLDPSIEYINSIEDDNGGTNVSYEIKFKDSKNPIVVNSFRIDKYLSSGTIKGLTLFKYIAISLAEGDTVVIDEIENHFHRAIVNTIIGIFKDSEINIHHSSLMFSTHYPELLDLFDRNDDIYVSSRKDGNIFLSRLSDEMSRNDLKRSDVLNSGYIEGTSPSYTAMIDLLDELSNFINKSGSEK